MPYGGREDGRPIFVVLGTQKANEIGLWLELGLYAAVDEERRADGDEPIGCLADLVRFVEEVLHA